MKKIITRMYDNSGEFIRELENYVFQNISQKVNEGISPCVLSYEAEIDTDVSDIKLGNIVKIFVSDKDTTEDNNGMVLIYYGNITNVSIQIKGRTKRLSINLDSYFDKLKYDILKSGDSTNLYSDVDDGLITMASDVVDTGFKVPTKTGHTLNDWTNPTNAYLQNGVFAECPADSINVYQDYYEFDFGIASGKVINGIEVEIISHTDAITASNPLWLIELTGDAGSNWKASKSSTDSVFKGTTQSNVVTVGGQGDLWNAIWSQSEFSDANFRIKVFPDSVGFAAGLKYYIDQIRVKVYYTNSEADIGLMARTVIDRYNAENGNPVLSYDDLSIPLTTTTAAFKLKQISYLGALQKLSDIAPSGTYYFIDENGKVSFKTKAKTPEHRFVLGKHIQDLTIKSDIEQVKNVIIIWNGKGGDDSVYKEYTDSDSIAEYGRQIFRFIDYSVQDTSSADKMAAKFLAERKDANLKIQCRIIDNNGSDDGYNIESIKIGDTCCFENIDDSLIDLIKENMVISAVDYHKEYVSITIEEMKISLADWGDRIKNELNDVRTQISPASLTT